MLLILMAMDSIVSQPIDAVDMCILTCDQCFKGDSLLNCANHCIFSEGIMDDTWKLTCPLFDNTPSVHQV